jgi:glycosyltransferase involved in cell wall biosynthesis
MRALYINGKFLAQPLTGVQRYALELLKACDRHRIHNGSSSPWVLLCPNGAAPSRWQSIVVQQAGPRGLPLHLWEQLVLPWAARGGNLLSLAGSAPWLGSAQHCTFHDAAVFDWPQAYRPLFVAWYRRLFRHQAKQANALFTVSAFSQQRLSHHLAVPPSRLLVVPNGADHLSAERADEAVLDRLGLRGQPYLLSVCTLHPAKNLSRLLQAFALLADRPPGLRLVIVGGRNPTVFAASDAREADPPSDPRVVWAQRVSDEALTSLYQHAQALVFPSLYEGFGLPPLEAMWLGCPVLAAQAASVPEICGDAALYFDPMDHADMARCMRTLLDDPALRQRLSAAGRTRALRWRWADAARQLLDHLGRLDIERASAR